MFKDYWRTVEKTIADGMMSKFILPEKQSRVSTLTGAPAFV